MNIEQEKTRTNQTAEAIVSTLPYRYVLINLFIHPRYGLFMAFRGAWWFRGLLTLFLLGGIAGALKALSVLPDLLSDTREVVSFLSDQLGDLRFADGRINWDGDAELPLTGHLSHLRVDVWAENNESARQKLSRGPEKNGILVLPDRVEYWTALASSGGAPHSVALLPPKMIATLESSGKSGLQPGIFNKQQLLDYVQVVCLLLFPVLALVYWLSMWGTTLFFAFFFSLLLQLRNTGGKFRNAAAMGLHCCLAPFVAAAVYHVFIPNLGRFENVFGVIFLVYVLFMMIEDRWFRAKEKQVWGL
jgi:hypothetical protein